MFPQLSSSKQSKQSKSTVESLYFSEGFMFHMRCVHGVPRVKALEGESF